MGDARNPDPLSHARALVAAAALAAQPGRTESRGRQLRADLHARSQIAKNRSPARVRRMRWRITMSGLFGTLSVALSGLSVSQQEMETTSNNVANANTPGYTREVPELAAGDPVEVGSLSVGHGSGAAKNREPARSDAANPNQSGHAAEQRAQRLVDATAADCKPSSRAPVPASAPTSAISLTVCSSSPPIPRT